MMAQPDFDPSEDSFSCGILGLTEGVPLFSESDFVLLNAKKSSKSGILLYSVDLAVLAVDIQLTTAVDYRNIALLGQTYQFLARDREFQLKGLRIRVVV